MLHFGGYPGLTICAGHSQCHHGRFLPEEEHREPLGNHCGKTWQYLFSNGAPVSFAGSLETEPHVQCFRGGEIDET